MLWYVGRLYVWSIQADGWLWDVWVVRFGIMRKGLKLCYEDKRGSQTVRL